MEYYLTEAFKNSGNGLTGGFWCDGVLLPDSETDISIPTVNKTRQVVLTAFTGSTGQERYRLILQSGDKAMSRYARGVDIKECLPGIRDFTRLQVDPGKLEIVLQLD